MEWEKIFAHHTLNKGLIYKIQMEYYSALKKKENVILDSMNDTGGHYSK